MREKVLNYMKEHNSITTYQAFNELNCTRLSEYIRQIKKTHIVKDKWVKTNKSRYKKYWLED